MMIITPVPIDESRELRRREMKTRKIVRYYNMHLLLVNIFTKAAIFAAHSFQTHSRESQTMEARREPIF